MFTEYVEKAMQHATYKQLDDGTWWGEVTPLEYTFAIAPTLDACRSELKDVVEDWLIDAIAQHGPIPMIDGATIKTPALA
ncbi:MAG: type II toxin-antitoxin system HicB family antitoxin [Thermomicrobiales bacterium]